jgi:osmotically-inducible protein OsmY
MRSLVRIVTVPVLLMQLIGRPLPAKATDLNDYSNLSDRNLTDRQIKREIRRAIWHDRSTVIYWSKVKVITKKGQVTLQGTVHSEDIKENIGEKAADVAGDDNVKNDLTVNDTQNEQT